MDSVNENDNESVDSVNENDNESKKRLYEAVKHNFIPTDKDCKQIYKENDNKSNQPTGPETPNTNNLIEPSNQSVQNSKLNENIELINNHA